MLRKIIKCIGKIVITVSVVQFIGEGKAFWNPLKCKSLCNANTCKDPQTLAGCKSNCTAKFISACLKNMESKGGQISGQVMQDTKQMMDDLKKNGCHSILTGEDFNKIKAGEEFVKDGYTYLLSRKPNLPEGQWTRIEAHKEKRVRKGEMTAQCRYQNGQSKEFIMVWEPGKRTSKQGKKN